MMRWQIRADDREQFEKPGAAARLLYIDAGAWAMEQVFNKRVELPSEWFIPASLVREWGKKNAATALVRHGIWERAELDGAAGYIYAWIHFENTPSYLAAKREKYRSDHRQRIRRQAARSW